MQCSLRSLFCENSGVDPDGSQKSGANYTASAGIAQLVQHFPNFFRGDFWDIVAGIAPSFIEAAH